MLRGLGLGFANTGGTSGKWDMCLCFACSGVGGVGGEWRVAWSRVCEGWVVLCLCVL